MSVALAPTSRLGRIARRARPTGRASEVCELCAASLDADHPHLLEIEHGDVRCACRACAVLFDRSEASLGSLRRIPDRRWALPEPSAEGAAAWVAVGLPVDLVFVVRDDDGAVSGYYPGPAGITRMDTDPVVWDELARTNPFVAELQPAVEALLVRRTASGREHFLVPITECFRLVGVLRSSWKGLSGGDVWPHLEQHFDDLRHRCRTPTHRPTSSQGGNSR